MDLFNDDTRPSGHISRPTQVNVSELLSFSKQLLKSNGLIHPAVSEICIPQSLDPIFGKFEKFWQMIMTVHNYRPRQFRRTSNGENSSSGYRDMGSTSLAAAHPSGPWWQYPSSPEGWEVIIVLTQIKCHFHCVNMAPWHVLPKKCMPN